MGKNEITSSEDQETAGISDHDRKRLVMQACLVAVWSDSRMSLDENRYLSHLTEMLAGSQKERAALRGLRLGDPNEGQVLSEVAALEKKDKAYVFDTCLEILASDRRLGLRELRFLRVLRKACDLGRWDAGRRRRRVQRKARARIGIPVRIAVAQGLGIFLLMLGPIMAWWYLGNESGEANDTPVEQGTGNAIIVNEMNLGARAASAPMSAQEVFEHARESIVSVHVFLNNDPLSTGSGSVIGKDKDGLVYVVTNRHVVRSPQTKDATKRGHTIGFEVHQHSGAKFDATLDFYSREHDLAFLTIKGMGAYAKPLSLTRKSDLSVGQAVFAIGSPIGLAHSFTAGVVSALRDDYLQTDATIYYGSSGGPLIGPYGGLCGVVKSVHLRKDYGFALYSDTILEALKERTKHAEKEAGGSA